MTTTLPTLDPGERGALQRLVSTLDAAGLDYPAEAARALRNPVELPEDTPPPNPLTLTDAELAAYTRELAVDASVKANAGAYGSAITLVQAQLAAAAASVLAEHAEELLNQMRPEFDAAAAAVHAAVQAGIRPGTRAEEAIRLGGEAAEMWNGLDAHARVLERVATIRTGLTESCGVPPGYDRGPFSTSPPAYRHGLAFGVSVLRFRNADQVSKTPVGRWLSVCTAPEPPRLLTVADTDAADAAHREAERLRAQTAPPPSPADLGELDEDAEELPRYPPA